MDHFTVYTWSIHFVFYNTVIYTNANTTSTAKRKHVCDISLHEIQQICNIYLPKYQNPAQLCKICCLKVEIPHTTIYYWHGKPNVISLHCTVIVSIVRGLKFLPLVVRRWILWTLDFRQWMLHNLHWISIFRHMNFAYLLDFVDSDF